LVLGEGLLNSPAVIGILVFKLRSLACACRDERVKIDVGEGQEYARQNI